MADAPPRVIWSPTALADVEAIQDYLMALRSPAVARRITAEIVIAGDSLATFPERGRVGTAPGTRELTAVRPYVLVYHLRPGGAGVAILRVLHGARSRVPGGTLP